MKVKRRLSLKFPWEVSAPEAYKVHFTSRFGSQPDFPFCSMKRDVWRWLAEIPERNWFGKELPAVQFTVTGPRFIPRLDEKIDHAFVPKILFARKADILLFKLTFGGRV